MTGSHQGSSVLVTGAVGGIGTATARAFAAEGARLALVDVSERGLASLKEDLCDSAANPADILTFVADVSDESHVEAYVQATVDRFGALDVLFNNAGVAGPVTPGHDYQAADFDLVMSVNVRGVWLNMKYAVLAMLAGGRGGSIVNTGSAVSLIGAPSLAPYTASKHAVLGLTRSVALELATSGIRVNAVCPGPTDTRMQRSIEEGMAGGFEEAHEAVKLLIPMRRHARPEEIAALVLFLASSAASFITGAAIPIDGAMTAD